MALLLHVLMLFILSGGSAEVVLDFEQECGGVFVNGKSPTRFPGLLKYKQICQTLKNLYYYATYYDTENKIPVYSAYRFEGKTGCKRLDKWYIEPQLDDMNGGPKMASEGSVNKTLRGKHQALKGDYMKSGYDRGHLAPVSQVLSRDCADATFTLTNAAPQNSSFNQDKWMKLEKDISEELIKQCLPKKYTVYIVTGVVPGTVILNKRVNVPSHFWTAYCCLDNNNKSQISKGFIGENKNIIPRNMTVKDLETELANLYKVSFEVFRTVPCLIPYYSAPISTAPTQCLIQQTVGLPPSAKKQQKQSFQNKCNV